MPWRTNGAAMKNKPGVKPIYDKRMLQYKVSLTPHHRATAQRLGKNLSDGIRKALEMAEEQSDG